MNYDDPLSIAEHCDPHDAFEVACRKHLCQLYAENQKLRLSLLRHIRAYRVDDDAYDPKTEATRLLELELCL
jgi:hypothetical protein